MMKSAYQGNLMAPPPAEFPGRERVIRAGDARTGPDPTHPNHRATTRSAMTLLGCALCMIKRTTICHGGIYIAAL
jgi:hypothetical protein